MFLFGVEDDFNRQGCTNFALESFQWDWRSRTQVGSDTTRFQPAFQTRIHYGTRIVTPRMRSSFDPFTNFRLDLEIDIVDLIFR